MTNLKITMKSELELKVSNTLAASQRGALIQQLREAHLSGLSRFEGSVRHDGELMSVAVNLVGIRVTGDSTNAQSASAPDGCAYAQA